jgi:hypothetical protein
MIVGNEDSDRVTHKRFVPSSAGALLVMRNARPIPVAMADCRDEYVRGNRQHQAFSPRIVRM